MLPSGHIEFTWAALNLVQRRTGLFEDTDYRLIALAVLAPDILDKPLALTVYRDTSAALFWGHNLWLHATFWFFLLGLPVMAARLRARTAPPSASLRRELAALPYLLAFSGHLIADRMWGFQESLLYPLGAGFWHPWVHVGEPAAMLEAYVEIIRTTPLLVGFEMIGAVLLAWFIWDRGLYEFARLRAFLRTGRPAPDRQRPGLLGRPVLD